MRASERCQSHHQGDRCRKARHHESNLLLEPDLIHEGHFAQWKTDGTVVAATTIKHKRKRSANRFVRNVDAFQARLGRKSTIATLDMIIKKLRGAQ